MNRLIINQFTEWKNKKNRKPLLVTGAASAEKLTL